MAGFVLPAELDIRRILDVHQRLTAELTNDGEAAIDAAAVTRIDTAGVQLLAAARQAHPNLTLLNPSAPVLEAFGALGLGHLLNH